MDTECMPLVRQLDVVIRTLYGELRYLQSGTVVVQIRNNVVGKFGIRHDPVEMRTSGIPIPNQVVMSDEHLNSFRQMALSALEHKKNWTHGEIQFEFAMRKSLLCVSAQLESNYNMASLPDRFPQK